MFLSLAGCNASGVEAAERFDLAGEWDWKDGHSEFPKICGSDSTIQYHADGSIRLWGEAGTWRLEGDVLTEIATSIDPLLSDRPAEDIGKAYVSTIKWIDQNRFIKRYADGEIREFRRCPGKD